MSEFSADSLSDAISAVFGSSDNASALQISDSAGVIRVTLGALGNGDYGLKVISTDGSTVIIDGTSDMFRIAASGTTSKATNTGDNSVIVETTLSGLGAMANPPAHMSFMGLSNSPTSASRGVSGIYITLNAIGFVASTSGGAVTNPAVTPTLGAVVALYLDGSSFPVYQLKVTNANAGAQTVYSRYFVLAQASL